MLQHPASLRLLYPSMSWLLDAELPLYDWSNSSHSITPYESLATLTPAVTYMNSAADSVTPTLVTSEGGILPRLTCHGTLVSTSQQWKTFAAGDVCTRLNFAKPILTQAVDKNLEPDSDISNQTVSLNGNQAECLI